MEIAELILKFIDALVWPFITIALAFIFRHEVRTVIGRVQSAKLPGGIELDLLKDQSLLEVHEDVVKAKQKDLDIRITETKTTNTNCTGVIEQLETEKFELDESVRRISQRRLQTLDSWGLRKSIDKNIESYRELVNSLYKTLVATGKHPEVEEFEDILTVSLLNSRYFKKVLSMKGAVFLNESARSSLVSMTAKYLVDKLWAEINSSGE